MPSSSSSTTIKTSFAIVFCGTAEHRQRLRTLVEKCGRIEVHTTHFVKFYLLNCAPADQLPLTKEAYAIIACLINNAVYKNHGNQAQAGTRFELRRHFQPFVQQYKAEVKYLGEGLKYFNQIAGYMSEMLAQNLYGISSHP